MRNPFKRRPKPLDPRCTPTFRAELKADGSGKLFVHGTLANGKPVRGVINVEATPKAN
ncbi:hypothetical protein ABZ341_18395 [Streptomyces sp. NPDC006173]|jgi:hypothetical protein|uniref:hypothetical protein n=1 Tax=Streptomyces sp. NPDC006173 TaxID=3155349 RepID=UPI0033D319F9